MKKKFCAVIILMAVLLSCLASCGKSEKADSKESENEDEYSYGLSENSWDSENGDSYIKPKEAPGANSVQKEESSSQSTSPAPNLTDNRKIIETVYLTVETENLDELVKNTEKRIAQLGGYVESSSYYGRNGKHKNSGSATLTVRVPSASSVTFTDYMTKNATVLEKTVSTDDVTLSYVDMESRVSALEAEKTALEELLSKAQTVDEIITVRESLTGVIYEIESYKSQLRTYDNLASYSTITINAEEVKEVTVIEERGTWEEIGDNIKHNNESIKDSALNAFIGIAGALPYIVLMLIFVIIAAAFVLIIRHRAKRKKQSKKNNEKS